MLDINSLVENIENIKPFRPSKKLSKIEEQFNKYSYWLWGIGSCLFIILCLLAVYHNYFILPDKLRYSAIILSLVVMLFISIALFLKPLGFIIAILKKKTKLIHSLADEMIHDEKLAIYFMKNYETSELNYLLYWLKLRINRMSYRITSFLGKDTALLSSLGLFYTINKNLGGTEAFKQVVIDNVENVNYLNILVVLLLAFIFGISLSAIHMRIYISQYQYRIEIIELALKFKKEKAE